jgi:hypothetical protein
LVMRAHSVAFHFRRSSSFVASVGSLILKKVFA